MKWLLPVVVAVSAFVQSTPRSAQLPPATAIPPEERLWLGLVSNGAGNPFPGEAAQIKKACGDSFNGYTAAAYFACSAKFRKPARYRIARLHAAPDERSPVIATLFEDRTMGPNNLPHMVWTLETATEPGRRIPWPDYGAAFDYGLHIAGLHRKGGWVRLLSSIPVDGWLRVTEEVDGAPIYIRASSPLHHVIDLTPLRATLPGGKSIQIEAGSYFCQEREQNRCRRIPPGDRFRLRL